MLVESLPNRIGNVIKGRRNQIWVKKWQQPGHECILDGNWTKSAYSISCIVYVFALLCVLSVAALAFCSLSVLMVSRASPSCLSAISFRRTASSNWLFRNCVSSSRRRISCFRPSNSTYKRQAVLANQTFLILFIGAQAYTCYDSL